MDQCNTGAISAVSSTVGSTATSASFTGLSQYYPLVASVIAFSGPDGTGSILAQSPVYPFFYARPYPPGWESLGLFVDSRYLTGTIQTLYDVSPNCHVFSATATSLVAGNYPTAGTSIAGLTYTPSTFTANRCGSALLWS